MYVCVCVCVCHRYELVDRCVQGLSAVFLAIRRRPIIRYQRGSEHAQKLADSLYSLTFKQVCDIVSHTHTHTSVTHAQSASGPPHTCLPRMLYCVPGMLLARG